MIADKKVLAVIPARGGSKGVPGKNIRDLNGKPLIAWSIEEAAKAQRVTTCVVSTDDDDIAEIARANGGNVPFMRPAEFATDQALSVDVVIHACEAMEAAGQGPFDYLVLLQPTTPLRNAQDIDNAVEKLHETGCDTVVSLVDVGANHPARMYTLDDDRLVGVMDEGVSMRPRQELPPVYIRSGDIYAARRDMVFERHSMMGKDCRAVIIPPSRSVNIDTHLDFFIAENAIKTRSP